MSSAVQVKVSGQAEVLRRLEKISAAVQGDVRTATKRAAIDTSTLAKRLAPVDTGRLRSSIQYRDKGSWREAEVFTDVEYAPYVEFGTSRMQAEPFLGPAWRAIQPHYIADLLIILRTGGGAGGV